LRFFKSIESTNNEALIWASQGAPDLSLIVANEQTAGRGRSNRKWFSQPDSSLAFSLILRPSKGEIINPARITGLAALALADPLGSLGLNPKIKWPNDVLLNDRKVAGVLVESIWVGEVLTASVLGMGVNVLNSSIPSAGDILFPPTSIERELGRFVDRINLLKSIILSLIERRKKLGEKEFMLAWENALAFRGKLVHIMDEHQEILSGELIGLESDGSLIVQKSDGKSVVIQFGEIHLRPTL
jgi:BirA family biotin operon repressor/biotin-[acetyl-CoA-carboxylase] ligase